MVAVSSVASTIYRYISFEYHHNVDVALDNLHIIDALTSCTALLVWLVGICVQHHHDYTQQQMLRNHAIARLYVCKVSMLAYMQRSLDSVIVSYLVVVDYAS